MSSPSPQRAWLLRHNWRCLVPIALTLCLSACGNVLGLDKYEGNGATSTASSTSSQGGSGGRGGAGAGGAGGAASPCSQGVPRYWDDFERDNIIDGWGDSSSMHTYDYSDPDFVALTNGAGQFPYPNISYHFAEVPVMLADFELLGTVSWTVPPGQTTELIAAYQFRAVNFANHYELRFEYHEGMNLLLKLVQKASDVESILGSINLGGNLAPKGYRVRLQVRNNPADEILWTLRVWPAHEPETGSNAEPASGTWPDPMGPDTGTIRMRAKRSGPGTLIVSFDDVFVCAL